ncbi:MAG: flagellar basal body P-ring formation chaperone FlgA [Hyphomicrobiaceae bacterium]
MIPLRDMVRQVASKLFFFILFGVSGTIPFFNTAQAGRIVSLPVANIVLYPGDSITNSVLKMRKFRSRKLERLPVIRDVSQLRGRVALRTILPGKPIFLNSVGIPDVIKKGSLVLVEFKVGSLTISSRASALQSGKTGEMITLRNIETGRVISGRVGHDKIVRVDGK